MSCELCERPATAYLCPACARDLAERLQRLPGLFAALGAMLTPARSTGGGRGATVVEAPIPVRLDVVDARSAFVVLPTWARALADDRRRPELTSPRKAVGGPDDLAARVTAACRALAAARQWIASSWPAAGDCAREVRNLYDAARTVTGTEDLSTPMGRCPAPVDGRPCGATLTLQSGRQVLRCEWCTATYPPGVWAALKREQQLVLATPYPTQG